MFELVDDYDPVRPQILPSGHIDGAGAAIFKMVDDLCLWGYVQKEKQPLQERLFQGMVEDQMHGKRVSW